MKHKVGDTVRIQSEEWLDAHRDGKIFVPEMICYAGKIANIRGIPPKGGFLLDINNGSDGHSVFAWEEWMFDPDYNPFGEPLSSEDAIRAMLDGETLCDKDGFEYHFDHEAHCFMKIRNGVAGDHAVAFFNNLYRLPVKHKRLMNRWEILNWANSDESKGWVVCYDLVTPTSESGWCSPQFDNYGHGIGCYWRARLLPDLSGIDESTIQKFEVEE
jgi:hypothetical protein